MYIVSSLEKAQGWDRNIEERYEQIMPGENDHWCFLRYIKNRYTVYGQNIDLIVLCTFVVYLMKPVTLFLARVS